MHHFHPKIVGISQSCSLNCYVSDAVVEYSTMSVHVKPYETFIDVIQVVYLKR